MKKIFYAILMLSVLVMPINAAYSETLSINADVNRDGYIDLKDALAVRRIVAKLDEPTDAADVNGDGKVTAKDVLQVRYALRDQNNGAVSLSVTMYTVPADLFQDFIDDISVEILREDPRIAGIEKLTYVSLDSNEAIYEDILEGKVSSEKDGNYTRIGKYYMWVLERDSVELLCTPSKLKQLFYDHGIEIDQEPMLVCMIDTTNTMPVVWIKSGQENFFLEYSYANEAPWDLQLFPYTEVDYLNKAEAEKATLTVNGKIIEDQYAYTSGNYATVSAIKILKSLGADIAWTSDTNATVYLNGQCHYINTEEASISDGNGGISYLQKYGGAKPIKEPVYRDIVIDEGLLINMLTYIYDVKYLEAKEWVSIDAETDTITITYGGDV